MSSQGRGQGRGRGRERRGVAQGRGQGKRNRRGQGGQQHQESNASDISNKQCYYCNKFGHYERDCRLKASQEGGSANYGEEDENLFLKYGKADPTMQETWLLDSEASKHMVDKGELFSQIDDSFKSKIKIGDNSTLQVEGVGVMEVPTKEGINKVNDIYYIPKLQHNLLSIGQMMENNNMLIFYEGKCVIYDKTRGNKLVKIVPMSENRIFTLKFGGQGDALANVYIENKGWLWHLRYGHLNHLSLKLLTSHQMVHGLPKVDECKQVCEGCALGKHHRSSFPRFKSWRASYPIQLVHSNICGPMQTKSMGMNSYFLTFIDDYSRMCCIYFLKIKDQAFNCFI